MRPYEPCLPTTAKTVPIGAESLHELKHDGFRLNVHRDADAVRLLTRRGYDWSRRFPRIVDQARRLKPQSFVIGAEAVFCRDDGVPDFDTLISRRVDRDVFAYGFDLLALGRRPAHPAAGGAQGEARQTAGAVTRRHYPARHHVERSETFRCDARQKRRCFLVRRATLTASAGALSPRGIV
jgi:hypothetical protein